MFTERKFSTETIVRIYDDTSGECVEVGPDSDIGELVEIRQRQQNGEIYKGARITMEPEQALELARAILRLYEKV